LDDPLEKGNLKNFALPALPPHIGKASRVEYLNGASDLS
jgi:hypothetical protein